MKIVKNKTLIASALFAACAPLFAADYTVQASGEWYNSAVWGGETPPVATTAETAIDNLSFASTGLSVKLTGYNAGKYYVSNIQGSSTETQTATIYTNSIWQNPYFGNITGNATYRFNFIWGVQGLTTDNPGNSVFRTHFGTNTTTSTFLNADVTVYARMDANKLTLNNSNLTLERYGSGTDASRFTSLTFKNGSSLAVKTNAYNTGFGYIAMEKGSSMTVENALVQISDYVNLDGNLTITGAKGSFIVNNKIRFNGGTLTLIGSDILTKSALADPGADVTPISFNVYNNNARIVLGGNESFDTTYFNLNSSGGKYKDTTRNITFVLHEDTTLLSFKRTTAPLTADYGSTLIGSGVNSDSSVYTWDYKYVFENFKDGVVKFTEVLTDEYLATQFVAEGWTNFTQDSDGFLHAVQVPEAAELACVFGAIALAFAALRRRK